MSYYVILRNGMHTPHPRGRQSPHADVDVQRSGKRTFGPLIKHPKNIEGNSTPKQLADSIRSNGHSRPFYISIQHDERLFWRWLPNEEALHRIQEHHPPVACESFIKYDEFLLLRRLTRIRPRLLSVRRNDASALLQLLVVQPLRHRTANGSLAWILTEPMREQSILAWRLLLLHVRQQRRFVAADSIV